MVRKRGNIGECPSSKAMRHRIDSRPPPGSGCPPLKYVKVQRPIVKSAQHGGGRGLLSFAAAHFQRLIVQVLERWKRKLAPKPSPWPRKSAAWVGRLLAAVGPLSLTTDRAIAAAGLAAAAGSAGFAGYMILTTGGVGGRDSRTSSALALAPPSISQLRQRQTESGASVLFDHEATGAIHSRRVSAEPPLSNSARLPQSVRDHVIETYVLRFVDQDAALVQGPSGVSAVVPGMRLPDVGTVLAIERREGAWIVLTESGVIVGP